MPSGASSLHARGNSWEEGVGVRVCDVLPFPRIASLPLLLSVQMSAMTATSQQVLSIFCCHQTIFPFDSFAFFFCCFLPFDFLLKLSCKSRTRVHKRKTRTHTHTRPYIHA